MKQPALQRYPEVSPIIWLGLPLASVAVKFLMPLLGEARWEFFMTSEFGFTENVTVSFLLVAIVLSVIIFLRRRELPRGVGWVMLLLAVGCVYFAGEEVSWGQHFFKYATPHGIAALNRQQEFNIHNTYGKYGGNLFNNLPRQLLNAAMVVSIVVPPALAILQRRLRKAAPAKVARLRAAASRLVTGSRDRRSACHWLLPNHRLILAASMAMLLRLPNKMPAIFPPEPSDGYLSLSLLRASGEFKEYCFALAIMLYVLSIYTRMGPRPAFGGPR